MPHYKYLTWHIGRASSGRFLHRKSSKHSFNEIYFEKMDKNNDAAQKRNKKTKKTTEVSSVSVFACVYVQCNMPLAPHVSLNIQWKKNIKNIKIKPKLRRVFSTKRKTTTLNSFPLLLFFRYCINNMIDFQCLHIDWFNFNEYIRHGSRKWNEWLCVCNCNSIESPLNVIFFFRSIDVRWANGQIIQLWSKWGALYTINIIY